MVYNATNNELVRTKTLVKGCIVQIDGTPFRNWYYKWYGIRLCNPKEVEKERRKQAGIAAKKKQSRKKVDEEEEEVKKVSKKDKKGSKGKEAKKSAKKDEEEEKPSKKEKKGKADKKADDKKDSAQRLSVQQAHGTFSLTRAGLTGAETLWVLPMFLQAYLVFF